MSQPAGAVLLHEFFDRRWREWRDRIAVDIPPANPSGNRTSATYAELAAASSALGVRLGPFVAEDAVVAVLLPRTVVAAFAAPLAIMRAGAAYTSLDPSFPDDRVREVLQDSQAVAVVTDGAGAARLATMGFDASRIVRADAAPMRSDAAAVDQTSPAWLTPASLAYVIYTSGTTGRPKGVMTEHRAIANLVHSDLAEFGLGEGDRVGQSSSHAYDSSIEEMWLAFASGATLVVLADDIARAGPDLLPWLERERITMLCPPPTLLRATGCRDARGLLPRLRLLYVGGEALNDDVVDVWAPGRRLVNGYGPTESAVTSIRCDTHPGEPVAIGRPVANVTAHIVDEALNDVADGTTGELCLGGVGLARGYRNDPELTQRKFPRHPVHGRLYRTGDLARRSADGTIYCLGRLDSQVKIRGYRIELEEIEARLSACAGVRAAAARVQTHGGRQTLVAFVVPTDPAAPSGADELRRQLSLALPAYMVPGHIGWLPSLPTSTGGKIDRAALPVVRLDEQAGGAEGAAPTTDVEIRIERILRRLTDRSAELAVTTDFFQDLGGDSLLAAELITELRAYPDTAALTVRDAYAAPTIEQLAARVTPAAPVAELPSARVRQAPGGQPLLASIAQLAWLAGQLVLAGAAGYGLWAVFWPWIVAHATPWQLAVWVPLVGLAGTLAYLPLSLAVAVLVKRIVVGRYVAGSAPVWGPFYVRHWVVCQTLRIVPWRVIEGTDVQLAALRALGARIGRRVHIHRGVDFLQGGWDLLEIGDDVTIGQEAVIRLVDLEDEQIIAEQIVIGGGATIETRASVAGGATIEAGGYLTALSSLTAGARLPADERWDGVPAVPAGRAPDAPVVESRAREFTPLAHSLCMLGSRLATAVLTPVIGVCAFIWLAYWQGVSTADLGMWLREPAWQADVWWLAVIAGALAGPVAVTTQAIGCRLLGRTGAGVIGRWSPAYLRVWAKTDLVRRAGDWLSGTLMWPMWLRAAGMQVGRGCEMSTIIDVVPELVTMGAGTFLADGVYLGGPIVHRGTVTLAHTTIGSDVFLGNHVVVPAGCRLADGVLIGVSTVASDAMAPGTSWFGHPPFALSRPPLAYVDRRLTHEPSVLRVVNRWVWELGRFVIPLAPTLVFLLLAHLFNQVQPSADAWTTPFVVVPIFILSGGVLLAVTSLAVKWLLLGRVRPGQHALWSCWCSRWDFMYMVWARIGQPFVARLEGTLLLAWYLRAMGMRIGRRVVLGPGFSQVVDPDMIRIDDDATVHALFQAHTFEDRMLKIDRVRIRKRATVGSGAVLFYGVDVGEEAVVAAQSVIMKHERLAPSRKYEGCPSASAPMGP